MYINKVIIYMSINYTHKNSLSWGSLIREALSGLGLMLKKINLSVQSLD